MLSGISWVQKDKYCMYEVSKIVNCLRCWLLEAGRREKQVGTNQGQEAVARHAE
jgi:hypothetical protein